MRSGVAVLGLCAMACGRVAFDPRADGGIDTAGDATTLPAACPADPRLIACYDFEGDVLDKSGHGNDAVAADVSFVPGLDGGSLRTTATSRIDVPTPSLDAIAFTIEVWVSPDDDLGEQLVMDHDMHWAIAITDGKLQCVSSSLMQGQQRLPVGAWTHVACTHDGTNFKAYVGGVLEVMDSSGPFAQGTDTATIAGNSPSTDTALPFVGGIDRLRVWNTALTSAELCAGGGC